MIIRLSLAALLIASSSPAFADALCGADRPVARVLTYSNGGVLVMTHWRGDFMQVCNLNETWKGITPATCFAWMSQIAGAISAGKRTGFYYGGIGPNGCATLPTYGNTPAPVYVDVSE